MFPRRDGYRGGSRGANTCIIHLNALRVSVRVSVRGIVYVFAPLILFPKPPYPSRTHCNFLKLDAKDGSGSRLPESTIVSPTPTTNHQRAYFITVLPIRYGPSGNKSDAMRT
jgi:hypothetical protein